MSEKVNYGVLKDYDGNKFIPVGHSKLVYDENGNTVEDRLEAIETGNVQKVAEGTKDGTIAVTTNGTTTDVPVHGLGFQDDGSYHFTDDSDKVIASIDNGGVHSVDFIVDGKDISLTGVKAQADALRTDLNNLSADAVKGVTAGNGLIGGGSAGDITLSVGAGSGITVEADTVSHADTSTLNGAQSAGAGKAITGITVDTFGHVTATTSENIITSVTAGDGLTTSATSGAIELDVNVDRGLSIVNDKVGHSYTADTDTTSTANPGYGKTFTVVDSVTKDTYGHVTKVNTKTVTMPGEQTVNNATITIAAGKGLTTGGDFTTNQSSNETITLNVGAGAGISVQDDTVTNAGVRSVAEGTKRGTIAVNTNGTTADVAVNGLGFEDDGSYHFIDNNEKVITKIDGAGVHATDFIIDGADTSLSGVKTQYTTLKSQLDNTKYAASTSVGGPAVSANKLNTNAGSSTDPVYFENGIPKATGNSLAKDITGNAASANQVNNKLTIAGKTYDGSAAVTVSIADLGVTGAMVYLGTSTTAVTDGGTEKPTIGGTAIATTNLQKGNVVLYGSQEFVWTGSKWELLGDEGSYALKTVSITAGNGLTGGGTLAADRTISHADTSTLTGAQSAGTGKALTSVTVDEFGHVTATGSSSFKTPQTAVVSPSTSGNASAFIDTISQNTNGEITVTKKNVQISIDAAATDDDVVVLTATDGTNKVTYDAKHAKKGPSSGYTSGNTETSISGSGDSGTIKIPQLTVDAYGHVTAAADESVTITMPSSITGNAGSATTVKQTATTTNQDYPVLLSGATASGTNANVYYDSGVTLNPNTNLLRANLEGNIATTDDYYAFIDSQNKTLAIIQNGGIKTVDVFDKNNNALSTAVQTTTASGTAPLTLTATRTGNNVTINGSIPAATASQNGYMTSTQVTKLNGIAAGAEVNQNAFSNVKVGSTTIAADAKTDTLELVASTNVTIAPDATNDKVTISVLDEKVKNEKATTTKAYVTGTTSSATNTGTQVFDTGVYLTETASQLHVGSLEAASSLLPDTVAGADIGTADLPWDDVNANSIIIRDDESTNTNSYATLTVATEGINGTTGVGRLTLGNKISKDAETAAGNAKGQILMYGENSGYTVINQNNNTANNITITLPDNTGTLATIGNIGAGTGITKTISGDAITLDIDPAGSNLGGVKTGGSVSISDGLITVNSSTTVRQTATTTNQDYPVLLAGASTSGTNANVYYDSGVTLNPSTNLLRANLEGNIVNTDAEYSFIDNNNKVMARISETGMQVNSLMLKEATITEDRVNDNALYINSPHTLYFNRPNNTSVVFQQNGTNQIRIDGSGNFVPYTSKTYNLGSTSLPWKNIYNYAHYLRDGTNDTTYGYLRISTESIDAATGGVTQLVLGNKNVLNTSAGNAKGQIVMYGTSSGYTSITPGNNTTSNYSLTLPSKSGTLAITSDLPTVNNSTITITAGSGLTGTNSFTLNSSSAKSIELAVNPGPCIEIIDDAVTLTASGVSAGTYGPSAGGNMTRAGFSIPQITVDEYGRITDISNKTINLTESAEKNRLLWLKADGKVYGGNHYASETQVSIANASQPDEAYTLYVGGTIGASGDIEVSGDIEATGDISASKNFYTTTKNQGYFLKDSNNGIYPGVFDNTENLWVGSTKGLGYHHIGETYISAGWNSSTNSGNKTIRLGVLTGSKNDLTGETVEGNITYPYVFHSQYLDMDCATEGTLSLERGGTGATTKNGAAFNILGDITSTDENAIVDSTQVAFRMVTPSATSGVLYTKSASTIYDYVASKATGYTTSGKKYKVQKDSSSGGLYVNVPWANDDTKNTAGSTDTSSKIFLIGATSQAANPQTYSHDTVYVTNKGILRSPTYIVQSGTGYGTESTMNGLTNCVVGQMFFVTG